MADSPPPDLIFNKGNMRHCIILSTSQYAFIRQSALAYRPGGVVRRVWES